jgi:hypothetical protein
MAGLAALLKKYPVAAAAAVVALAFGGWTAYQSTTSRSEGPHVLPAAPPIPVSPAAPPAAPSGSSAVSPTAPAGTAPGGGTAASTVTPTAAQPETMGEGRANPFEPLASPGGTTVPAGGAPPGLPPVPPLAPTEPPAPAAPPPPDYRVVGFLWAQTAYAILEDGEHSYIVGPGDVVTPGVRVVAIDVPHEVLHLTRDGTPVDLTLRSVGR